MNKKAFSLMEALVAIILIGICISIFSRVQIMSIVRFGKFREEIDRVFLIKKRLIKHSFDLSKKNRPIHKDYTKPYVKITSEIKAISNKSSLKWFSKNVNIVEATGRWNDRDMTLITFVVAPVETQDEKK